MLTILITSVAYAVGGAFAGPIGEDPPTSSGTQLTIVPDEAGNTLVLTVQVARAVDDLAVLWPAPGLVETSVADVDTRWFDRIEAVTRPRVEELTCRELVEGIHWRTPPGCSSYDYVPPEPLTGEDAISSVPAALPWADVDLRLEVIEPADLPGWLADRGLQLDPTMAVALQPHLDAGELLLTIQPDRPVPADTWLPPVRFRIAAGDVVLPLTIGAAAATTRHELHVYGVASEDLPNPSLANYPAGLVQDECLLPEGDDAGPWLASAREQLETDAVLPPYVVEYAKGADTCDPCVEEVLDQFELSTFGLDRDPDQARISRIWMAFGPGELDEDPIVTFTGAPPAPVDLHFLAHDPDLGFAFPVCGSDGIAKFASTCPNIHLPGSGGCRTTGPASLAVVLLAAFAARRRRSLAGLLLLVALAVPARAANVDLGPRTEVHGALAVFGTDRVIPQGLDHGAPWLGNPYFGGEVRRSWIGVRNGLNVGILGGVRGWAGRAAPGSAHGVGTFWFVEPQLGLDVRHGRFREASPCAFGRYGIELTVSTLTPSVSGPSRFVPSAGMHLGYGWWVGRGIARTSVELRGSVVPRTDGYETRYHPNLGLPGFMFYPGTANLWIVVGRAWY